jgi:hypothetical protein
MSDVGKHRIVSRRGDTVLCEFNCYCSKPFIYVRLSCATDGNFVIKCPTCEHLHYRTIEKGEITDIRWGTEKGNKDTIEPMPSASFKDSQYERLKNPVIEAVQKKRRTRGLIAIAREKEAVGEFKHWGDFGDRHEQL